MSAVDQINVENLCEICNKKIRLGAVQCKCKRLLCKNHVFPGPNGHNCQFDYKLNAKIKLQKDLVKINPLKVNEI